MMVLPGETLRRYDLEAEILMTDASRLYHTLKMVVLPGGTLLWHDLGAVDLLVRASRLQDDLKDAIDLLDFQTHRGIALANELEEEFH